MKRHVNRISALLARDAADRVYAAIRSVTAGNAIEVLARARAEGQDGRKEVGELLRDFETQCRAAVQRRAIERKSSVQVKNG